ncbi:hypothetical protein D1872_241370 [compost metagenome]
MGDKFKERISLLTTIEKEIFAHFDILFTHLVQRNRIFDIDDRHREPGLHTVVQKNGVEILSGMSVQTERDIGDSQYEAHFRMHRMKFANRFDRLDCGGTILLFPATDGESE